MDPTFPSPLSCYGPLTALYPDCKVCTGVGVVISVVTFLSMAVCTVMLQQVKNTENLRIPLPQLRVRRFLKQSLLFIRQ